MEEKTNRAAMRNQNHNLEEDLLNVDRRFNKTDNCLASNVLNASDAIMYEIESFHDPELSQAMRRTLCTLALG